MRGGDHFVAGRSTRVCNRKQSEGSGEQEGGGESVKTGSREDEAALRRRKEGAVIGVLERGMAGRVRSRLTQPAQALSGGVPSWNAHPGM